MLGVAYLRAPKCSGRQLYASIPVIDLVFAPARKRTRLRLRTRLIGAFDPVIVLCSAVMVSRDVDASGIRDRWSVFWGQESLWKTNERAEATPLLDIARAVRSIGFTTKWT